MCVFTVCAACASTTVQLVPPATPGPSKKQEPTVHVVGMLQHSEQPSAVIPDNVPDNLEFHWIDVPTLVRAQLPVCVHCPCFSTTQALRPNLCVTLDELDSVLLVSVL